MSVERIAGGHQVGVFIAWGDGPRVDSTPCCRTGIEIVADRADERALAGLQLLWRARAG
jgi:hypothetical protein